MMSIPLANAAVGLTVPDILLKARQMILVVTDSWESNSADLQLFSRSRDGEPWRHTAGPWWVVIGRNGMAWAASLANDKLAGPVKKEGDGKAPAGVFTLGAVFGFAPTAHPNLKLEYFPITQTTLCIDDTESQYYGQMMDSELITKKDWKSAEIMFQYPQQYKLGIVVNYNAKGNLKQGGSCIFLHVKSSNKGTAGCTAMTLSQVTQLSHWLDPKAQPVIVQLPKDQYRQLQARWWLP